MQITRVSETFAAAVAATETPPSDAQVVAKSGIPQAMLFGHWYVAALAAEVTPQPIGRVILGESIVLYRQLDGTAVALSDRCPHRGYPLSAGKVENGAIVCGYHGFAFDGGGACVYVPGQTQIPRSAVVRAYALEERGSLVWIWMGERTTADPGRIPDHRWDNEPAWASFAKGAVIDARYGLLIDNLLDLSHETYVHSGTIGSRDVAETAVSASFSNDVVHVSRHMEHTECPPFYVESTGLQTPIDRWQDIDYHVPSFYVLHVRIAPAGATDESAVFMKIMYAITPIDAHQTRLFWIVARDFAIDRADVSHTLDEIQDHIVAQDRVALELLESVLPTRGSPPEVSVAFDRGALLARRALHALAKAGAA